MASQRPPDNTNNRPKLRLAGNGDGEEPPAGKRQGMTRIERQQILSLIEAQLTDRVRPTTIYETLRRAHEKGYATPDGNLLHLPLVSKQTFRKMVREVEALFEEDRKENRTQAFERWISRVHRHMRKADAARNFHAVARFEEMIAKAQGFMTEKHAISVSFAQSEHVARILGEGDDYIRRLCDEQADIVRKAELYEKITGFDAIGEPVHSEPKPPENTPPALPERGTGG
jgi:hypothetical protein